MAEQEALWQLRARAAQFAQLQAAAPPKPAKE
jgi:hypothetical protein